jgi:hypothetical protein
MKRSSPASHISVQSASHQRFESVFESRPRQLVERWRVEKFPPGFGDLRGGPALGAPAPPGRLACRSATPDALGRAAVSCSRP